MSGVMQQFMGQIGGYLHVQFPYLPVLQNGCILILFLLQINLDFVSAWPSHFVYPNTAYVLMVMLIWFYFTAYEQMCSYFTPSYIPCLDYQALDAMQKCYTVAPDTSDPSCFGKLGFSCQGRGNSSCQEESRGSTSLRGWRG